VLLPILGGAALGALYVIVARSRGRAEEARLLAIGLPVAALIYVALAVASAGGRWLALEASGAVLFAPLAWLGLRVSPWCLTVGWMAHVGWDVGLHLDRAQPVVGAWYPLLCVGFDLVVAGYLLSAAGGRRPAV
jgi:hypothetical protein